MRDISAAHLFEDRLIASLGKQSRLIKDGDAGELLPRPPGIFTWDESGSLTFSSAGAGVYEPSNVSPERTKRPLFAKLSPLFPRLSTVHNGLGGNATVLFAVVKMTLRFA